jgi:hypothetical protein
VEEAPGIHWLGGWIGHGTVQDDVAKIILDPTGTQAHHWPRGVRHELSSVARTLGSWVLIPLKVWISACDYSLFVLSCVGSGLATS